MTHIEKSTGPEYAVVIMHCGLVVMVHDDGSTNPPGADWVLKPGEMATCRACRLLAGPGAEQVATRSCLLERTA
jgi:hypothetical protein